MNKDLTTGKPEKVLWQFCLPLFGSIIFQQLYNIADSFVAGKFISDNALARRRQQLRNYAHFHRLCLRLQHRVFGSGGAVFRREAV